MQLTNSKHIVNNKPWQMNTIYIHNHIIHSIVREWYQKRKMPSQHKKCLFSKKIILC